MNCFYKESKPVIKKKIGWVGGGGGVNCFTMNSNLRYLFFFGGVGGGGSLSK